MPVRCSLVIPVPASANIVNIMITCAGVVGAAHSVLALTPAAVDDLCSLHLSCLRNMLAGSPDPTVTAQDHPPAATTNPTTNPTTTSLPCSAAWEDLALRQFLNHQQQQQLQQQQQASPGVHISAPAAFDGRRLSLGGCGAALDGMTVLHAAVGSCDSSTAGSEADSCSDSDEEKGCPWPCDAVIMPWAGASADARISTSQEKLSLSAAAPALPTPPARCVLDAPEQLLQGTPAAAAATMCRDLWHLHLQGLRTDLIYLMLCPPGLFCGGKPASWDARMYISVLTEVMDYLSRQQLWHLLAALLQHLAANGLRLQQSNSRSIGSRLSAQLLKRIFADVASTPRNSQSGSLAPVTSSQQHIAAPAVAPAGRQQAGFWDEVDTHADLVEPAGACGSQAGKAGSSGRPSGEPSTFSPLPPSKPPSRQGSIDGKRIYGSTYPPPSPNPRPCGSEEHGAAAGSPGAALPPAAARQSSDESVASGAGQRSSRTCGGGYGTAMSRSAAGRSRRRSSGYRCACSGTMHLLVHAPLHTPMCQLEFSTSCALDAHPGSTLPQGS
jgi:hypothetical protein